MKRRATPPGSSLSSRKRVAAGAVFQDAFACLETEIQAIELRILLFQVVDHPQALQVMLETFARRIVLLQRPVQRLLAGVAERCVSEIVRQRNGLDQILVQSKTSRNRTPHLRDFERVRHPGSKQVTFVVEENLCLVNQAPERRAVNNAVAITLERVAQPIVSLDVASPAAVLLDRWPRATVATAKSSGPGSADQTPAQTRIDHSGTVRVDHLGQQAFIDAMQTGPSRRLDQDELQGSAN